jgi:hypothetical protein
MIISDDKTFRFTPAVLRDAMGWELKPEGFCRGDVCVPVRGNGVVGDDGLVDLRAFAALLRQPLALDEEVGVAVVGESSATRAAQRLAMKVDDFTLSDIDGNEFRWSSIGRKKKLLFAWASW